MAHPPRPRSGPGLVGRDPAHPANQWRDGARFRQKFSLTEGENHNNFSFNKGEIEWLEKKANLIT